MSKLSKFSDWLVIVCSCLLFMLFGTVIAITLSLLIYDYSESKVAIFIFMFSGIAVGGKFGDLFGTWLVNKVHNENVKWQSRWIKEKKED